MKKLSTLVILVLVVGLVSCAAPGDSATGDTQTVAVAVNADCPLTGRAVGEGKLVEYKGTTIGLCCDNCMARWPTLTMEEMDAALETAVK